jgi:hypothetical protein
MSKHPTRPLALLFALAALPAVAAADEPVAPADFKPWAPHKVNATVAGDLGSLTAKSQVRDPDGLTAWQDPLARPEWKTDQAWRFSLPGPLFAFGQLAGGSTEAQRDMKIAGKYGLGCKLEPMQGAEFTLRTGPALTYTDPLRPDFTKEKSEFLVEMLARVPLLGPLGLEYQGTASPALTPLEHDWLSHDLRLAAPVGADGKLRLGAKCRWDDAANSKPLPDALQLYLGFEFTH